MKLIDAIKSSPYILVSCEKSSKRRWMYFDDEKRLFVVRQRGPGKTFSLILETESEDEAVKALRWA